MRTTITINDRLYRALKIHAAQSNETISTLIEEAIKYQILEDLEDLDAISKRKSEPTMSFDAFVKELKADGLL